LKQKIYGNSVWEELYSSKDWGKYPPEEVIRFYYFASRKLKNNALAALDIGCGKGACTGFLRKGSENVTAFDGAPSGLESIYKLANEFGVKNSIDLVHGDIMFPKKFINNKYDILLDNYSLYSNYEEQIINALKDYYDIMKSPSYFLMNCFGEKTTGFGLGEQISRNTYTDIPIGVMKQRGVVTWFSKRRLLEVLGDIGYIVSYYENILYEQNGDLTEKHITCLQKQ